MLDTLRLDVDGDIPLMLASGLVFPSGFLSWRPAVSWITRKLTVVAPNVWEGDIVIRYPDPIYSANSDLPQTHVRIEVSVIGILRPKTATVTFSGEALPSITREFTFESLYFRHAEFEFDALEGVGRIMHFDTSYCQIGRQVCRCGIERRRCLQHRRGRSEGSAV